MHKGRLKHGLLTAAVTALSGMAFSLLPAASAVGVGPPPPVVISSIPLSVVVPTQPQVLIALTNSMSMDSSDNVIDDANNDLSIPAGTTHARAPTSAIMTWSGYNRADQAMTGNAPNTAPANYIVPTGFTPPITGGAAGSSVAYTAPVNTYSITTPSYYSFSGWQCIQNVTVPYTSTDVAITRPNVPTPYTLPNATAPTNPPWPSSTQAWDPAATWYYNGTTDGMGGTGYFSSRPPAYPFADAITANGRIPNARQWFHGTAEALARNSTGGLRPVGMGPGNGTPPAIPNALGSPVPPPTTHVCTENCGGTEPTSKAICGLYQYYPPVLQGPSTSSYTQMADNAPSRLNIAKASIIGVVGAYGTQVDFGLMIYNNSNVTHNYNSWAYYMSGAGGFTPADFSNTYQAPTYVPGAGTGAPPVLASQWVTNPCWKTAGPYNNCKDIADTLAPQLGLTTSNNINTDAAYQFVANQQFLQVASRSDDPSVNDVVLEPYNQWDNNYQFFTGGTLTPSSPYPPNFSLQDYNGTGTQTVVMNYSLVSPSSAGPYGFNLYPTNSGFVPSAPQVIYSYRGVPWVGTPSATSGRVLVSVQAAAGVGSADQQAYLQKFAVYLTPENDVASNDLDTVPSSFPGATPAITYYDYYKSAIKASALQSPMAGLLTTAADPSSWPTATAATDCPPPKYVILITDGLPTLDKEGHTWPPPGSAAAAGYGVTLTANGDGTITTNDDAVNETIAEITTLNQTYGIKTFVVGMGPGVDPSLNPEAALVLQAMAIAGGTQNYLAATSPAAVVQGLGAILNKITSTNVASVSGAVNSSGLNTGSVLYQATYTGYAPRFQDWTGDLQAFPIASDGTTSTTANWSAQCELDKSATGGTCGLNGAPGTGNGWGSRIIATCGTSPDSGCAPGSGVAFNWHDLDNSMLDALRSPGSGFLHSMAAAHQRVDYLRGDTANELVNGGLYRNRSHILGDIVDSGALYVAAPGGPYGNIAGYNQFVSDNQSRTPMIYVGANDGMLHAFDAADGKEAFAFVPNGVFGNLIDLTDPNYNNNHKFFVDGTPVASDVKFANGSWRTVLAGGLNDGGRSIYALDITDPGSINSESALKSDVLWEFTDPHLGLTYSQPVFALTEDTASVNANPNGFLLFFGSGYNNSDQNPYLYAVNPETGQIVSRDVSQAGTPLGPINLCAAVSPDPCDHTKPNGLSGVAVVNDNGILGAPATTVYAGDLQGHLWKIAIDHANPASWRVSLLFTATDATGNPQPITDTPVVSLNPQYPGATGTVVYFGTGQYLGSPDIINTNTQGFYGVRDSGNTYVVSTCDLALGQHSMTRCDLVQQSINATSEIINGNNVTLRTITSNAVDWSTGNGWFIDLPLPGERVITNPRLYSGEVVFTTYVPSPAAASTCSVGGQSFLMVLNYKNGSSFPKPQLDLNDDGQLDASDQVNGQNPVGISLGNVFASAPTILAANLGGIRAVKEVTLSSPVANNGGYVQKVGEAGGTAYKITWTQLP